DCVRMNDNCVDISNYIYKIVIIWSYFKLSVNKTGLRFNHEIVASDSNDGLLNAHANRIQTGKLTFKPFIQSSQSKTLMDDIINAETGKFLIRWEKDGSTYWVGTITTKIFSHPERQQYFSKIRAVDFDILKNIDYPLNDSRQIIIDTITDLLDPLHMGLDIVTRTSWTESHLDANVTGEYDFLGQIYHETKALRELKQTSGETDQPITYMKALQMLSKEGLFVRQLNGKIYID